MERGGGRRDSTPKRDTGHMRLKIIDKGTGQKAQQRGVRRGKTSTRPVMRRRLQKNACECHAASVSSGAAPQNARRQTGFSPPKVIAEIPQRDPRMQPQERRWNWGCRLRVPSPKMGAA